MIDPRQVPDGMTRTGHFVFRVWRKEEAAWSWRLRIEVVDTGVWGIFDSMQDALWFMREHMMVDDDREAAGEEPACVLPGGGDWIDDLSDPSDPVG